MANTECPICCLPYDSSKNFISTCVPCGHCACNQCLNSLKTRQCPFCYTRYTQVIKIFIETEAKEEKEKEKPSYCANCSMRADMYCPQCISNFCKSLLFSCFHSPIHFLWLRLSCLSFMIVVFMLLPFPFLSPSLSLFIFRVLLWNPCA